jgi:hypothetical protein
MSGTIIETVRARRRLALIAALREALAAEPPGAGVERVVLFGSVARGDFDGGSDVDLFVLGDGAVGGPALWHALGHHGCDIVTWTIAEHDRALAAGHPMAQAIAREGVELWPATP